jgi:hypothetical protein
MTTFQQDPEFSGKVIGWCLIGIVIVLILVKLGVM